MTSPAEEHRRKVAQMRVGEIKKQKYRPPKGGPAKGNRVFARKDGRPIPARKT